MPKTSGYLEATKTCLQIDVKEVPFIVRTILGHLGWGNFFLRAPG